MVRTKIIRSNCDDHSTVCIFSGTVMIAHSVDCKTMVFRRSIYNISARAHTESIDSSSIVQVFSQFICCCRKIISPISAILREIDQCLWVFDTDSDSKRFCAHRNLMLIKHLKCITGAVANRKNGCPGRYFFFCGIFCEVNNFQRFFCQINICDLCMETEFPAKRNDFLTHLAYNINQDIRTDMRLMCI